MTDQMTLLLTDGEWDLKYYGTIKSVAVIIHNTCGEDVWHSRPGQVWEYWSVQANAEMGICQGCDAIIPDRMIGLCNLTNWER
jgi:hypothetical protein